MPRTNSDKHGGKVKVPAFGKLNLSLLVLHKRGDGFHELRTVFQTIALHDSLTIEFARGRRTRIEVESNVEIPGVNLVARAAEAVLAEVAISATVRFQLTKRIPMGGGLAGGSTDAAAVLLALPLLAGKPIPFARLHEIAAQLGSDVPVFLKGGAAVALGRGEELYALPDADAIPVLLGCSGIHVSTPEAFRALRRGPAGLTSPNDSNRMERFQLLVEALVCPDSAGSWMALCENDFEGAVFPRVPRLDSLRHSLIEHGARLARMSGSGSTLFGVFGGEKARDRAMARLTKEQPNVQWVPTTFISRHEYRRVWRRALASVRNKLRVSSKEFGWIV
ncbi:MAG: 4-(cytidine 5'-diphospho)-2-C-methyl-D-erythritol kinase [Bryobacterales bacterium]|nr:4-(cytidine 5'-diphospho)-2-C-methyl-D-erythritol kinase [Bryobacterales bacterium]